MEKEIWKDIPNFKGYQVSNLGRVRSFYKRTSKGFVITNDEWCIKSKGICSNGYEYTGISTKNKKTSIRVHQLVAMAFLGYKKGDRKVVVDHIDNNKLNNKLDNLQVISQRLNSSKDKDFKNKSSKYTGVSWHKTQKKWISSIRVNGKLKHLGSYLNEIDAHVAYQEELKKINAYI